MLKGVHIKFNFSLNLSREDLKVVPAKEEIIAYHLRFFLNFFEQPLFFYRFLKRLKYTRLPSATEMASHHATAKFRLFQMCPSTGFR